MLRFLQSFNDMTLKGQITSKEQVAQLLQEGVEVDCFDYLPQLLRQY